jgi:hypothetical protein
MKNSRDTTRSKFTFLFQNVYLSWFIYVYLKDVNVFTCSNIITCLYLQIDLPPLSIDEYVSFIIILIRFKHRRLCRVKNMVAWPKSSMFRSREHIFYYTSACGSKLNIEATRTLPAKLFLGLRISILEHSTLSFLY